MPEPDPAPLSPASPPRWASSAPVVVQRGPLPSPSAAGGTVQVWNLGRDVTVELRSSTRLTPAHYDLLAKYVDLAKMAATLDDSADNSSDD